MDNYSIIFLHSGYNMINNESTNDTNKDITEQAKK